MNINTNPTRSDWTPRLLSGLTSWIVYNDRLGGFVDMLKGELVFPQEHGKEYRMPSTIKLLDLVAIPSTRHLWPKEFDGLIKAWEETKSNDQLGIIADWLDDNDEPELAHAFRWCYRREIPFVNSDCRIEKKHLPWCLHYDLSYDSHIVGASDRLGVCGTIAYLVGMFAEIREAIA